MFRAADAPCGARPPRTPVVRPGYRHRFRLGVVLHHFLAHLAAPAGLLEAAERPSGVAVIMGVDADRAGLDLARERMGDLQIVGPDARLQAIFGRAGLIDKSPRPRSVTLRLSKSRHFRAVKPVTLWNTEWVLTIVRLPL